MGQSKFCGGKNRIQALLNVHTCLVSFLVDIGTKLILNPFKRAAMTSARVLHVSVCLWEHHQPHYVASDITYGPYAPYDMVDLRIGPFNRKRHDAK